MIDVHTHILPGIDDGSRDLYESLEMAQIAAESGTQVMVATPHCNLPRNFRTNFFDEEYRSLFDRTEQAIRKEGIPLRLLPGMEVYITEDLPQLLVDGKIMPLNGSRYVLMEFAMDGDPDFARYILPRIRRTGAVPVIAHVERYGFLQDDPLLALRWREEGDVIQCNKGSFLGRFGRREMNTAYYLMDCGIVDVIASDTHRPVVRTPDMGEAYELLAAQYPEDYIKQLFHINPGLLCLDKPIMARQPVILPRE